jgi:GT2 family glycosyltransferase
LKLTVVIPCRNEVRYIRECLDAIFHSNLPAGLDMSVFVVDGISDDGTIALLHELKIIYPGLQMVENHLRLTPFAFNLGIHAGGKADYVLIVGARQILSANYITDAIRRLQEDASVWCVGGQVENEYLNQTGKIISRAMSTAFGMGLGNFRTLQESGYTDTVGTPMYNYEVFEKIGFFDEQLVRNQDDDFNFRVLQAGGKIWFEQGISLKYYVRANFKGLYKQFFQYGYWKVFVNRKHQTVTTVRQLVPPLFVLFVLLSPLTLLFPCAVSLAAAGLLTLYLLLALYFAVRQAEKAFEVLSIFMTFPILHVSYGLGYLLGILSFLVFRRQPSEKQKRLSR